MDAFTTLSFWYLVGPVLALIIPLIWLTMWRG